MNTNKKNIDIDWLLIFIFVYIALSIFLANYWFIFLYVIPITYIFLTKKKILHVIIYFIASFIPLGLSFLIKDFNCFEHLSNWINTILKFSIRDKLLNYVNESYDSETTGIINLFIFNKKDNYSYDIYKMVGNLSITYLVVISGFHLNILKTIIEKILYKPKILGNIFAVFFILFYTYLLNFSISTSRVLISTLFGFIFYKNKNKYIKTACSGILSMIIYPRVINDIGFNLSYLCTFCVIYILSYKIKNFFINQILICFVCTIISLPFITSINNGISLFAIINSLLFTYFINIFFVILLLTFLIKWIYPVQKCLCWFITNVIVGFNLINIVVNLKIWNLYFQSFYIAIFFTIAMIIRKKTNFIFQ